MESLNFALDAIDLRMTGALRDASEAWHGAATHEALMLAHGGLMTPSLEIETMPLDLTTASLEGWNDRTERYETFKSARIEYKINRLGTLFLQVCLGSQTASDAIEPSEV